MRISIRGRPEQDRANQTTTSSGIWFERDVWTDFAVGRSYEHDAKSSTFFRVFDKQRELQTRRDRFLRYAHLPTSRSRAWWINILLSLRKCWLNTTAAWHNGSCRLKEEFDGNHVHESRLPTGFSSEDIENFSCWIVGKIIDDDSLQKKAFFRVNLRLFHCRKQAYVCRKRNDVEDLSRTWVVDSD